MAIGLADGSTVDGLLHAYSLTDDESTRTIALKSPLRQRTPDGKQVCLPDGYFLAFESDIKYLTMQHAPIPDAAMPNQPNRDGSPNTSAQPL